MDSHYEPNNKEEKKNFHLISLKTLLIEKMLKSQAPIAITKVHAICTRVKLTQEKKKRGNFAI